MQPHSNSPSTSVLDVPDQLLLLLVFPTLAAANIAYNLLKTAAGGHISVRAVLPARRSPSTP